MLDKTHPHSDDKVAFQPKEFFNEQWQVYQKVLNNNYMEHHEISCVLHKFLLDYLQKPFKMLDLGCGDASFTAQALLNTAITSYKGIDLSVPALEIANSNMAKIPCKTTLIVGDFSQVVDELVLNPQDKFDAILISFALHHLNLQQKDSIIGQLRNLLTSDGVLILIDVVRQEGEDRETYVQRYLDNVQKSWSLLTSAEYFLVANHISTSDFPETQQTLQEIFQKHGFSRCDCFYRDSLDTTRMLCFSDNFR
ncbi:MAG: class I SAM-dependent methyltransferase [Desmonostoc vinosum HA7617-LM4]|jgi:ubiquinone/menaquinone biosynthesis C-methylase UbiE|nr:class I SAM-dependent methyltransferase [Desmonostoc vinosum HA7617-LM4]